MYKEEDQLLRLLENVASQGLCCATLPTESSLYNELAAAMVNCGRKLLKRQAASSGTPVDHFADEAAMDMLRYLDRLLALPSEDWLPYYRACVKNVFLRYIKATRLPQEVPVVFPENTEQLLLRKEAVTMFLYEASVVLTQREFYSFFYVRLLGLTPSELEASLQSTGQTAMIQALIGQLCALFRIPSAVFDPIAGKQERKGSLCARSITQAIQRADHKMRPLAMLLL